MKTIVQHGDLREFELKPSTLLNTYLQLTQSDVKKCFIDGAVLLDCKCPACISGEKGKGFVKFGLRYWECSNCQTLYVSPRPDDSSIDEYYKSSKARKFWNKQFSTATEAIRRDKVFKPRVQWIIETVEEYLPSAKRFSSINAIHRPFLEELIESDYFKEVTIINQRVDLDEASYAKRGVRFIKKSIESVPLGNSVDAVALFEAIDQTSDIDSLFRGVQDMLISSGLCFLTTISVSGFDLQVLWEKSNSIFPPDRINALSIEGLGILFERHGFECIELSTPGLLDIEIVANAYKEDPSINLPRFVKYLLDKRDDDAHQLFQEFLQMNRLSSFARIVLRKK
jgi:hypothetical protein